MNEETEVTGMRIDNMQAAFMLLAVTVGVLLFMVKRLKRRIDAQKKVNKSLMTLAQLDQQMIVSLSNRLDKAEEFIHIAEDDLYGGRTEKNDSSTPDMEAGIILDVSGSTPDACIDDAVQERIPSEN